MSRSTACAKLAIIVLTAVTLAGCGRKGPLEPPPSASVQPQASQRANVPGGPAPGSAAAQAGALFAPQGEDPAPAAAPGQRKPFILDSLLD